MVKMPKEVIDMFNAPDAFKVLATVDEKGKPNVVPVGSICAINEETIGFAVVAMRKTRENLEMTRKVAATVFKIAPTGYQIKGTFEGFQTSGALYDEFAKRIKEKLKIEIRGVGAVKIEEIYSVIPHEAGKRIA